MTRDAFRRLLKLPASRRIHAIQEMRSAERKFSGSFVARDDAQDAGCVIDMKGRGLRIVAYVESRHFIILDFDFSEPFTTEFHFDEVLMIRRRAGRLVPVTGNIGDPPLAAGFRGAREGRELLLRTVGDLLRQNGWPEDMARLWFMLGEATRFASAAALYAGHASSGTGSTVGRLPGALHAMQAAWSYPFRAWVFRDQSMPFLAVEPTEDGTSRTDGFPAIGIGADTAGLPDTGEVSDVPDIAPERATALLPKAATVELRLD
ncbi:hypothetical protein [Poseidonocella sp. HB161398]|uniref:hypothetical protein n=1 Tax=Poseidonocella sp. HB161398 TaxID=2320855 RepID=UPI0011093B79|nr:hypothetical protein [Poseidonocella sp. HB161398]